jgi:hypothetical protein
MPFERLRTIVFADLRQRGVSDGRLDEYARSWAAAATHGSHAPMPCPACFANGVLSGLKGRSVSDGYAAATCSNCNMTLQFSKGPQPAEPTAPGAAVAAAAKTSGA